MRTKSAVAAHRRAGGFGAAAAEQEESEREALLARDNTMAGDSGAGSTTAEQQERRRRECAANASIAVFVVAFVVLVFVLVLNRDAIVIAPVPVDVQLTDGDENNSGSPPLSPATCAAAAQLSPHQACGDFGAVSTTHYLATKAAVDVLQAGGNAIDASVAAQLMLGVVQPESTGLGGGAMFLVYNNKSNEVLAYDGREEAPALVTDTAFCVDSPSCTSVWPYRPERCTGGLAVGVPGVLAVTDRVLREHGTVSMAQLAAPAITVAREGFPMTEHLHHHIGDNAERLALFPASRQLWLNSSGTGPRVNVGETFSNPDLAATYELLLSGDDGVASFYGGSFGQEIVAALSGEAGRNPWTNTTGVMQLEDLASYRAVRRRTYNTSFRGNTVFGHAPPTSGGLIVLMALNLLEAMDASAQSMGTLSPSSPEWVARLINAQNLAFADRNTWIADSDFVSVPGDGLLDKAYAASRVAELVSLVPESTMTAVPIAAGSPPGTTGQTRWRAGPLEEKIATTHFSVADQFGNVVSWTTTIEVNLGSGITVPGAFWGSERLLILP